MSLRIMASAIRFALRTPIASFRDGGFRKDFKRKGSNFNSIKNDRRHHVSPQDELEDEVYGEKPKHDAPTDLSHYKLSEKTIKTLEWKGIKSLFPIQAACFEAITEGRDIIGKDRTGTGKTLAYALPVLEKLRERKMFKKTKGQLPYKIVLVPTRELAVQVGNEYQSLINEPGEFHVAKVFGGASITLQQRELTRGSEIVVGTPGRVKDLIERGILNLSELRAMVLDETDTMLDMGFQRDIETILKMIQVQMEEKGRKVTEIQFLLFSATIPKFVLETSRKFMAEGYKFIDMIGNQPIKTSVTVQHIAVPYPYEYQKWNILKRIMKTYASNNEKTIIFTETKSDCFTLQSMLPPNIKSSVLNGDIPQDERSKIMNLFRKDRINSIVTTNVLARGIDFKGVDLIIQASVPNDVESYIHRSGRTGRAGKNGVSIIMYNEKDRDSLRKIEKKAFIRFEHLNTKDLADIEEPAVVKEEKPRDTWKTVSPQ